MPRFLKNPAAEKDTHLRMPKANFLLIAQFNLSAISEESVVGAPNIESRFSPHQISNGKNIKQPMTTIQV